MDYFIDDMINSSSRGSSKSHPISPAPPEPPLPPAPTLTRRKKSKGVKFPEKTSSSVAGSSKIPDTPIAAAIPLPETPAPSTLPFPAEAPTIVETATSPKAIFEPAQLSYFSAAELAGEASTSLHVPEVSNTGPPTTPAFFTPMSLLPPTAPEMTKAVEKLPVAVEGSSEPAPAPEEQESMIKPVEEAVTVEEPAAVEATQRSFTGSLPPMLHIAHLPIPTVHSQPAMLIGISGCPSSGKSSIAHLLSVVLPPSTPWFIIHQDDFLIPEHLMVPGHGREVSHHHTVDLSAFKRFIDYSKREGWPPPAYKPLQSNDEREYALSQVTSMMLEHIQSTLADLPSLRDGRPVGIIDGGLLYHSETIRNLLDIKLLLRTSRQISKNRRFDSSDDRLQESGSGRKFWDTREFFNRTGWPNYVQEHEVLFNHGDVEGRPTSKICKEVGIAVQPNLDMGLEEVLRWVVDVVCRESEKVAYHHDREMASMIDMREEFEFCNCNEGFLGKVRQRIFDML
ncbi:MAG: hypothetical protein Q9166_002851 [cf. Caloplaca sp. 2 TL-2023]